MKPLAFHGRLFQARMWREYAMTYDGHKTSWGIDNKWVVGVLKMSRAECMRRSLINVKLARRLRLRGLK